MHIYRIGIYEINNHFNEGLVYSVVVNNLKDEQSTLHASIIDFSYHVNLMYDKRKIRKIIKRKT